MKKMNVFWIVTVILLIILHGVTASAQELTTILEMVDHIEKRIDRIDEARKSDLSNLKKIINNPEGKNGSVASNNAISELLERLKSLEADVQSFEARLDLTELDSTVTMLVSRTASLEADFNHFEKMGDHGVESLNTGLVSELRNLTQELRQVITNTSNLKVPESKKITPEVKAYFHYHHDGTEGDGQSNAFDFNRVYIGAKYKLSDSFTARYLTDIGHQGKTGKLEVFTKYAYLDWNLGFWKAHLIVGLQGTRNWKEPEKAWGYRVIRKAPLESFGDYYKSASKDYVHQLEDWSESLLEGEGGAPPTAENTALANNLQMQADNFGVAAGSKMGSSADMGLALSVKPTSKTYAHMLVINGTGYKKVENNPYKNIQLRTGGYLLNGDLHVSGLVEAEPWLGVDGTGKSKRYTNILWDLFVSYGKKDRFMFGLNTSSKKFAGSYEDINASCYSGFGNISLIKKKVKVLARYDLYHTGLNQGFSEVGFEGLSTNANLIILGLDWMPAKGINIIPNIQILSYDNTEKTSRRSAYVHLQYKF